MSVGPHVSARRRLAPLAEWWLGATVALLLGVALSYAMYRWHPPYTDQSPNPTWVWVLTAIPFAGLAVLIACGLRRSAAVLGWIVLAALTFLAYENLWGRDPWSLSSASMPLGFQMFYGVIVLVHLSRFRGRPSPAERVWFDDAQREGSPRRYGLILLVCTGIAALPCLKPWADVTGSVVEFCVLVIAPLWLSTVFILIERARDRASMWAARGWLVATLLCLPILFFGVLLSHVTLPAPG